MTQEDIDKLMRIRDVLNQQMHALSTVTARIDALLRVQTFGEYLAVDATTLMMDKVRVESAEVIATLEQAIQSLTSPDGERL